MFKNDGRQHMVEVEGSRFKCVPGH